MNIPAVAQEFIWLLDYQLIDMKILKSNDLLFLFIS